MSFATAAKEFAAQAARERRSIWPITVSAGDPVVSIAGCKGATQLSRVMNEQGSGYVQRTIATFHLPVAGTFRPDIGAELTITDTETSEELNTSWRCFEFTRGHETTGVDHRLVCFRLD